MTTARDFARFAPGMQRSDADLAMDWVRANAATNTFASSLLSSHERYGSLTVNQQAAVLKKLNPISTSVAGSGFTALIAALNHAKASGLKRPKLTCGSVRFSLAPDTGKNPGMVYVKEYEQHTDPEVLAYFGKIDQAGVFYPSQDGAKRMAEIARIGADPLAEAIRHGQTTGNCAVCSKALSDPKSVEIGIGPVCAKKYGWSK